MRSDKLKALLNGAPTLDQARRRMAAIDYDPAIDTEIIATLCKEQIEEDLQRAMEEAGTNQSKLADKIGRTRQYVSQTLREPANLTIDTMAMLCAGLGRRLIIRILGNDEAMPVVPTSLLPDVRRLIAGLPTRTHQNTTQSMANFWIREGAPTVSNDERKVGRFVVGGSTAKERNLPPFSASKKIARKGGTEVSQG